MTLRAPTDKSDDKRRPLWPRLAPVAAVAAAIAAVFALGLDDYLSFETLRDNRQALLAWVDRLGPLAGVVYMVLYATVVALSVPGAVFMTLAGGFLFGAVLTTVYTVIGATAGATAIFLIATTALGDSLRRRAGPGLKKMEAGFQQNALSYLLVLRLVPLFPFWLVNLVPALLGVRLSVFVIATFFGFIPGTFVFSLAGAGLGSVFDSGADFSLAAVLTPHVIGALIGLAALALVPVGHKWVKRRRAEHPK